MGGQRRVRGSTDLELDGLVAAGGREVLRHCGCVGLRRVRAEMGGGAGVRKVGVDGWWCCGWLSG